MVNLCIDIGNTAYKLGFYKAAQLVGFHRLTSEEEVKDVIKQHTSIAAIMLSSTRVITDEFAAWCASIAPLHQLHYTTKLPIKINYETPQTLGMDRVAAACGVFVLYPNENCIIINAGTCITADVLDANGVYLGGNISPGITMRAKAMHEFTAKLPLVPIELPTTLLGKNTTTAMQNGAVKGAIYELNSFISEVYANYGTCRVVVAGGDTNYLVDNLNFTIFAHQNLVLRGLNEILKFQKN